MEREIREFLTRHERIMMDSQDYDYWEPSSDDVQSVYQIAEQRAAKHGLTNPADFIFFAIDAALRFGMAIGYDGAKSNLEKDNAEYREKMGKTLTEIRKDRGETISSVADAVGVSENAIQAYEDGLRVPRDEVKIRLSKYYGVPVEKLFF